MEDLMDKPTTSPISTRKHGDVLIVLSNNPPVNASAQLFGRGWPPRSSRRKLTTACTRS